MTTNFFSPLSFVAVFGSGMRDLGSRIRDKHPGSATLICSQQEKFGNDTKTFWFHFVLFRLHLSTCDWIHHLLVKFLYTLEIALLFPKINIFCPIRGSVILS
jgi:hypothetical protein